MGTDLVAIVGVITHVGILVIGGTVLLVMVGLHTGHTHAHVLSHMHSMYA